MNRKIKNILLIFVLINGLIIGCQSTAQKPLQQSPKQAQSDLTDNEKRIMTNQLSNIAEKVNGVNEATILIASTDLNKFNYVRDTGNVTDNQKNNFNFAVNNSNNRPNIYSNYGNNIISKSTSNYSANNNSNNIVTNESNGIMVLIGINANENVINNSRTWSKVREEIIQRVKSSDSRITQVIVTADPETVQKINNISEAVIKGEPVSNYENEIKNILVKINA